MRQLLRESGTDWGLRANADGKRAYTGFDAMTPNTLWVDKNLQLHGIIQAFSRTNGILNSAKTFGNCKDHEIVVDIERCISTSLALRDKRELVDKFIESMSAGEDARAASHENVTKGS